MPRPASILVAITLFLLAVGIVMVGSASRVKGASGGYEDAYYFLKRQILWLAVAALAGLAASRLDYHLLQTRAVFTVLLSSAILLLTLVLIPGIGSKIGGSRRWLRFGVLSLQPSEAAKYAIVIALAVQMTKAKLRAGHFKEGFLYPILPLGLVTGLIFLESDYGTAFLVALAGMTVMFVGGTRLMYLVLSGTLGGCAFILAVMQNSVRMGRILAFLFPQRYPDVAYHLQRSKYAFIMGHMTGLGLNRSVEKHYYLPEAHTDFIFAILGEELGVLGTLAVTLAYLGILWCGLRISARAPDPFGRLLAVGLAVLISLQALINIAVVTGCLPTKGLALPFISYGGSSLIMSVAGIGLLVNIARQAPRRRRRRGP